MKKTDYILIGLVIIVLLIAVFTTRGTDSINFPLKLVGEVGLKQISFSEYNEMVLNEDPFIVIIEREGCTYCKDYMPIVEEVANEKMIPITYIDTEKLTQDEYLKLTSENKYLNRNDWGTPTTLFMLGDRIVDSISGYVEKSTLEKFLNDRVVFGE